LGFLEFNLLGILDLGERRNLIGGREKAPFFPISPFFNPRMGPLVVNFTGEEDF